MVELKRLPAFFYCTAVGNEPVREWLKALDDPDRRIVGQDIATAEFGWPIGMPVCRSLGTGLYDAEDTEAGSGSGIQAEEGADGMSSKKKKKNGRVGSSFDDYLKEQGTHAGTSSVAIKRVLAWQLESAMAKNGMSKNEMARQMRTSRSQLDRILDPENDRIQLDTVFKAARVLGREVRLELV